MYVAIGLVFVFTRSEISMGTRVSPVLVPAVTPGPGIAPSLWKEHNKICVEWINNEWIGECGILGPTHSLLSFFVKFNDQYDNQIS